MAESEVFGTLTLEQGRQYLGFSRRTMYVMANEGTLPGVFRIGSSWRIDREIFFAHAKSGVHSGSQLQGVDNRESRSVETGVSGETAHG